MIETILLSFLLLLVSRNVTAVEILPGINRFVFTLEQKRTLPGRTSTVCPEPYDDAQIAVEDVIDTIAIVTMRHLSDFDEGNCETSPTYSHTDYPVQMGTVSSVEDMIVDGVGTAFVHHHAYNISSPLVRATGHAVSPIGIFFKPTHGNISYDVYAIDEDGMIQHITNIAQSTVESAWGKNEEEVSYNMYVKNGLKCTLERQHARMRRN